VLLFVLLKKLVIDSPKALVTSLRINLYKTEKKSPMVEEVMQQTLAYMYVDGLLP